MFMEVRNNLVIMQDLRISPMNMYQFSKNIDSIKAYALS